MIPKATSAEVKRDQFTKLDGCRDDAPVYGQFEFAPDAGLFIFHAVGIATPQQPQLDGQLQNPIEGFLDFMLLDDFIDHGLEEICDIDFRHLPVVFQAHVVHFILTFFDFTLGVLHWAEGKKEFNGQGSVIGIADNPLKSRIARH